MPQVQPMPPLKETRRHSGVGGQGVLRLDAVGESQIVADLQSNDRPSLLARAASGWAKLWAFKTGSRSFRGRGVLTGLCRRVSRPRGGLISPRAEASIQKRL